VRFFCVSLLIAATFAVPIDSDVRAVKDDIVALITEPIWSPYARGISGASPITVEGGSYTVRTRYSPTEGYRKSSQYVADQLASFGYSVVTQTVSIGDPSGRTTRNIIGIKTGSVNPRSAIVLGVPLDSVSDDPEASAPGAEISGAAVAGLLSIAKALSTYRTEYSVHFAFFGGEEQGFNGSTVYLRNIPNGDTIVYSSFSSQLGYFSTTRGVWMYCYEDSEANQLLTTTAVNAANSYGTGLTSRSVSYFEISKTYAIFHDAGIPSMMFQDWDWSVYPHYFRATDTFDKLDSTIAVGITKAWAALACDLARAY